MNRFLTSLLLTILSVQVMAQGSKGFRIVEEKDKQRVAVLFDNKLLTAYCYYDSSRKPMLFPVNTVDGITVTRSYPFAPVAGERTDHPHHAGIWLNYESVNGLDFWNNSTAIAVEKRNRYGTIRHRGINGRVMGAHAASLGVAAQWVTPDERVLLDEKTVFDFTVRDSDFIIDRTTTLTATDSTVYFKDAKDGMFAIRVARQLELPSKEATSFVDDKGNVTTVAPSDSKEVTGMYYSSNGLSGDSVWATRGKWVMLTGKKQGEQITIGMFDHPSNTGYPAYWHARGYGLFAVNPLGQKIFSNGKEELNFSLAPGKSVVFKYRIVVHAGNYPTREMMDRWAADFEKK